MNGGNQQDRVSAVFVWHGFPPYAARLVGALAKTGIVDLHVVASRPPFPVKQIENAARAPITWLDPAKQTPHLNQIVPNDPQLVFSSGWAFAYCNELAKSARNKGASVFAMVDNRRRHTTRQILGCIRFRTGLRHRFDGFLVPGKSATSLLEFFGVSREKIWQGLYGADPSIFACDVPLSARCKRIVFVGQMVERKGVDVLLRAFTSSGIVKAGWSLTMIGRGPLESQAQATSGVTHYPLLASEEIATHLHEAQVFAFPSRDDNWGVALHEAALAGCYLVTTDAVGAAADIMPAAVGSRAGSIISPGSISSLTDAFRHIANADPLAMQSAASRSQHAAQSFGPARFKGAVLSILNSLGLRNAEK